jgi:hypothetical protein
MLKAGSPPAFFLVLGFLFPDFFSPRSSRHPRLKHCARLKRCVRAKTLMAGTSPAMTKSPFNFDSSDPSAGTATMLPH